MSEDTNQTVVIAGAGHAAGELATSLRQNGYAGRVVMVGAEPYLPYQRPPLSKAFLAGEIEAEALYLKPQATYDKANVEFIANTRVDAIDRAGKNVTLSNGQTLHYDKLALAIGGRARKLALSGAELSNIFYLRTIEDVNAIRSNFESGKRLVIVGGGYVGLEVAAVAIKRGLQVTVLESMPRVLARVTAPEVSAFYEQVHRGAGVNLLTGVEVKGFEAGAENGKVGAVVCGDGTRVPADLVIVGVGLIPNTELAEAAGLAVDNGIVVDEFCRTSDPDIYAAGDCTNHPSAYLDGRRLRLESVPNALEQARTAAACIAGKPRPYNAVPWFWSDQYELKLQMVGLSQGYDQVVLRGSPAARSFIAFYLRNGKVIAADAISRSQEFMLARRIVSERIAVDVSRLADESVPLKTLMEAVAA